MIDSREIESLLYITPYTFSVSIALLLRKMQTVCFRFRVAVLTSPLSL